MKYINLQELDSFTLELKPGMAWAMYMDEGPTGICGQSMSITCPHCVFATWPDEEAMRADVKKIGRGGSKSRIHWGVVGEWGTANCGIVEH